MCSKVGVLPDPPASSSEAWSTIIYALQSAAGMVARYSHAARSSATADDRPLQELARAAQADITRLAAAVLFELGAPVDPAAVLAAASEFIDEIDEEDDGLLHASDALGSLLHAKLACLQERIELPDAERAHAAVAILAPLVAQAACLHYP